MISCKIILFSEYLMNINHHLGYAYSYYSRYLYIKLNFELVLLIFLTKNCVSTSDKKNLATLGLIQITFNELYLYSTLNWKDQKIYLGSVHDLITSPQLIMTTTLSMAIVSALLDFLIYKLHFIDDIKQSLFLNLYKQLGEKAQLINNAKISQIYQKIIDLNLIN